MSEGGWRDPPPGATRLITSIDEITNRWLTDVLRLAGAITQDGITSFQLRRNRETFNSEVYHLELGYGVGAAHGVPRHILVKLNADHAGSHEVGFYRQAQLLQPPLPMIVTCYLAEYDAERGRSVIVLADLSATHAEPVTRSQVSQLQAIPSDRHLRDIVDTMAAFHAAWWEHPMLGKVRGVGEVRAWYRDQEAHERHRARRKREYAQFIAAEGGWLPRDLRLLLHSALDRLPHLWTRYLADRVGSHRLLTMTNGDCYFSQLLCSRAGSSGRAYLIDFQDATANFAAYDLVYLFATCWTPAQRRSGGRERAVLRRYHDQLVANGVSGYGWNMLLQDYRIMIHYMIFDPIWNQTSGAGRNYWRRKLTCLIGAFQDHGCDAL